MAGRPITKRGMTDTEFKEMVTILDAEAEDPMRQALRLRSWFSELAIKKYMSGYHTGYKRGRRGTVKDHFDEDLGY